MNPPPRRPRHRAGLAFLLIIPMVAPLGCGDGTVRGAGSIEIPEDKMPKFPMTRPDFKAKKARGNPSRSR